MYVLLFCASPAVTLRDRIATLARDSGLREILPSVYQGELTPYRRGLLLVAVESALRRARAFHVELLTLPSGHFLGRYRRVRG